MTSYCIFSVTAPAGALHFPVAAASSLLNGTEDVSGEWTLRRTVE